MTLFSNIQPYSGVDNRKGFRFRVACAWVVLFVCARVVLLSCFGTIVDFYFRCSMLSFACTMLPSDMGEV